MENHLTVSEVAHLLKVSEKYLLDVIVFKGELTPLDDTMQFNEAEVLAYVSMDRERRKDALRRMAEEDGL